MPQGDRKRIAFLAGLAVLVAALFLVSLATGPGGFAPGDADGLFAATIGGLGLTGIIDWVELQLMPIKSSLVDVVNIRFDSLDEFFALSRELDGQHEYAVAWIDCAARGASAAHVNVVMPHYAYARSDKKDAPRISIGARLVADLLHKAGAQRVVTMALHSPQVHGMFEMPVDHLSANHVMAKHFRNNGDLSNAVVVSPDFGNVKEANHFARLLDVPVAADESIRKASDPLRVVRERAADVAVVKVAYALVAPSAEIQHSPVRQNVPGALKPLCGAVGVRCLFPVVILPAHAAFPHLGVVLGLLGLLFLPCLVLLLLAGLDMHQVSIRSLFSRKPVKGRALEMALIGGRFALYLGLLFWLLPVGMAFAFLGVQLAVFGVYMGGSFAPNHVGMPIVAHDAKLDFLDKQVLTSRNVSGGWWMTALMGGLNYQIEHHLFPSMPRPHLFRARKMVLAHCRAQGVPYTETSLREAWVIVIRYMNEVGLSASRSFRCPTAGAMGRP